MANTRFQRRQAGKKRLYQIVAMAQSGLVRNGGGKFKAKTEIVRSLRIVSGICQGINQC
ncbi:hypothetical protein SEES8400_12907 [Salmonella enterica subsp. enterica serovar Senftenberg str. ATCC 8400]|nr:hypothetical protein SEES8400_12907 [Salmonella enterica subsp. enterica serovar Senftenberg str. ATCC 8400]